MPKRNPPAPNATLVLDLIRALPAAERERLLEALASDNVFVSLLAARSALWPMLQLLTGEFDNARAEARRLGEALAALLRTPRPRWRH